MLKDGLRSWKDWVLLHPGTPGQRLGLSFQQGCGWSCDVIHYDLSVDVGETKVLLLVSSPRPS